MPSSSQPDRASPAAAWTWLLSRLSGTVAFAMAAVKVLEKVCPSLITLAERSRLGPRRGRDH
jgi:hypothetical protein